MNLWSARNVIVDDAYIEFRCVSNLIHGYGYVWNPGEAPFEISTNFLFTVLLAPVLFLNLDPVIFSHILGIISVLFVSYLIYRFSKECGYTHPVALFLSCLYLTYPTIAISALSGLQTSFFIATLFLFFYSAFRARKDQSFRKLFFLVVSFLLVIAARTEGAVFASLLLATVYFLKHSDLPPVKKPFFTACLLCALLAGAFFAWKLLYFGSLITGPMLIKLKSICFMPGKIDLLLFIFQNKVYFLFSLLSILLVFPKKSWQLFSILIAGLILLVYSFSCHLMGIAGRYFMPTIPFLLIISADIFEWIFSRGSSKNLKYICVFAGVILINCSNINPSGDSIELRKYLFQSKSALKKTWTDVDVLIGKQLGKLKDASSIVVASEDIGGIGYYSGVRNVDLVGIANPYIAKAKDSNELNNRIFSYKPDIILFRADRPVNGVVEDKVQAACKRCCVWGQVERSGNSFRFDQRFKSDYVLLGSIPDSDPSTSLYDWVFWMRKDSEYSRDIKNVVGEFAVINSLVN